MSLEMASKSMIWYTWYSVLTGLHETEHLRGVILVRGWDGVGT